MYLVLVLTLLHTLFKAGKMHICRLISSAIADRNVYSVSTTTICLLYQKPIKISTRYNRQRKIVVVVTE